MSTAEPAVLILGQHPDPHIEAVRRTLEAKGARVVLLDRSSPQTLVLEISGSRARGRISAEGGVTDCEDVASVWWRVKPAAPVEFSGGGGSVAERFRWSEWKSLLRGLGAALPRALWVNPLGPHAEASNKVRQLMVARDIGFTIPDTVIGNDSEDVLRLFGRADRVVYKTLSSFLIPPDEIIFTNEVEAELIAANAAEIQLAPGIYQEYVEKQHELRVTIAGNEIFVAVVHSQQRPDTRVDWRRDQLTEMYESGELEAGAREQLMAFMARFGLLYAAFDLIVRPDGTLVFLECNPGGQWLWLEHRLGLRITDALTEQLWSGVYQRERELAHG